MIVGVSYYPFGLVMSGISSKAAGSLSNKYKYNGKELQSGEFSDGSGLETYDFGHRMQDPQLGKFWQIDRFASKFSYQSPYAYAGNNPIKNIDVNGDSAWVQYKDANGVTQTVNNKSVNNPGDAVAAYGKGAKWLGMAATMGSNQNGEQKWQLNADGSVKEIKESKVNEVVEKAEKVETVVDGAVLAVNGVNAASNSVRLAQAGMVAEVADKFLGPAGLLLAVANTLSNPKGWETKNKIDLVAAAISCVCPVFGSIWYSVNVISQLSTGKTLSDYIQDNVDEHAKDGKW